MSVPCVKIEPDNEVDKILYKYYTSNYRKCWIEVGEEKICMPEYYATIADDVENFEVKDTDIYLTSHPKTGTTWTQEMIWMIMNNLDFEGAKEHLFNRMPFLEFQGIFDYEGDEFTAVRENAPDFLLKSIELSKNYPYTPRLIKTHMPFSLLPRQIRDNTRKPKLIHVIRNAKDTCVSYYYHSRLLEGYKGTLEDFCKLFMAGRVSWGPFFKNILGYVHHQHSHNILIIKYEDMKKNLAGVILQVAHFLERAISDEQLTLLEDHLSFKKMQHNPSVNLEDLCANTRKLNNVEGSFMRSGTVGSYKEDLTQQMIQVFDEWTNEETNGSGLSFEE